MCDHNENEQNEHNSDRYNHCGTGYCGCSDYSYGSGMTGATTRNGTGDCYCDCQGCTGEEEE